MAFILILDDYSFLKCQYYDTTTQKSPCNCVYGCKTRTTNARYFVEHYSSYQKNCPFSIRFRMFLLDCFRNICSSTHDVLGDANWVSVLMGKPCFTHNLNSPGKLGHSLQTCMNGSVNVFAKRRITTRLWNEMWFSSFNLCELKRGGFRWATNPVVHP